MLKLSRIGPHQWRFVYPAIFEELVDEFHTGCEFYEEGRVADAEVLFRLVLARMPDHLDAIHHLALMLSDRGETMYARDLWSLSVVIGQMAFPPQFEQGVDRLEWGYLDNRPFLRCLRGFALTRYEDGEIEEALGMFQELLSLNPNDNQGVRAMALEALFALSRWEDAFQLTQRHHGDIFPETIYGRPLALFRLGQQDLATVALTEAVEHRPRIRAELLKKTHRRPRSPWPGRLVLGGPDEAYEYWERWGEFWKDAPGALEWLREVGQSPTNSK